MAARSAQGALGDYIGIRWRDALRLVKTGGSP
jgi:hypothetical protein